VKEVSDESTKEIQLINSDNEGSIHLSSNNGQKSMGKIQMKKQLGLLEGVAIILGIIFGSGILNLYIVFPINGNSKFFFYYIIFLRILYFNTIVLNIYAKLPVLPI